MRKRSDDRPEISDARRELKEAVAELRGELDEKTKQGKKLIGTATGAVVVAKLLLKMKRRR